MAEGCMHGEGAQLLPEYFGFVDIADALCKRDSRIERMDA